MRFAGLGYRVHPLIKGTLKRRSEFDDLEKISQVSPPRCLPLLLRPQFARFIEGMTKPKASGGFELAYSPESEARIYYTGIWNDWDLWQNIHHLEIPTLILRGVETDTFWESTATRSRKRTARSKSSRWKSRRICYRWKSQMKYSRSQNLF